MSDLQHRIDIIRSQVAEAAQRAGRDSNSVQLIAVSKRHPAAMVRAAYACGLRDFGENYVQELEAKAEELADLTDLRWHLIGHLQTNKAKVVAKRVHSVHTLDNTRVVSELDQRARAADRRIEVYVEVNIGDEAQKSGCHPDEVAALIDAVNSASALSFKGLMTVGQRVDSAEAARETFVTLRQLRDRVAPNVALSMGMSGDFAVAIEEGSTCVRVGTAIFGERAYLMERS